MLALKRNWQSDFDQKQEKWGERERVCGRGRDWERGKKKEDGWKRGFKSGRKVDLDHHDFQHERCPTHMALVPIGQKNRQAGK